MPDSDLKHLLPGPSSNPKAQAIIEAATELFMEKGYGATSMDAVSTHAQVSKPTVYAHFTDKAGLFAAVISSRCDRELNWSQGEGLNTLPLRRALTQISRHYVDFLFMPGVLALFRVVIAESPRFPELGEAFFRTGPRRTINRMAEFLAKREAHGELDLPSPDVAATQLLALLRADLHLQCLLTGNHPGEEPTQSMITHAIDMFLRAYAGKNTA